MGQFKRELYAHRGASLLLPENTIESFRQGLLDGATALELDVQCTKDNVAIVFHDHDSHRLIRVRKRISDCNWSEVKTWDVGAHFKASQKQRHFGERTFRVPKLAEVLEAFPNVFLNIDIKSRTRESTRTIVEEVRRFSAQKRVRLVSYDNKVINAIREFGFIGAVGFSRWQILCLRFLPYFALKTEHWRGDAVQVPLRQGIIRFDNKGFIQKCHKLGLRVDFWTVDDRQLAAKLFEKGADGIMSNDPANILPVFS